MLDNKPWAWDRPFHTPSGRLLPLRRKLVAWAYRPALLIQPPGRALRALRQHRNPDRQHAYPAGGRSALPGLPGAPLHPGNPIPVRYREHDISQVLELTVEEALALFEDLPAARSRL